MTAMIDGRLTTAGFVHFHDQSFVRLRVSDGPPRRHQSRGPTTAVGPVSVDGLGGDLVVLPSELSISSLSSMAT